MGFYLAQILTGLASASSLFLVASGLSLIFGVSRIVNFAHGSLYMLGAYIAYTFVGKLPPGMFGFWSSIFLAALAVGLFGLIVEVLLLRRIYQAPELFQLVATFGVVLIVQDLTLWLWGADEKVAPRAPGLSGVVRILGEPIPQYDLALIVVGPAVLAAMWLILNRTRWGTLIRAATLDRDMVAALGVNQKLLFTGVFFLGACLAGLGGALQIPRRSVGLSMDRDIIAEAFVVVVIGGMGSIPGAFIAAVLIGELNAFGILVFPAITNVLVFLVMGIVLIVRPWGLLGRPETAAHAGAAMIEEPLRTGGRRALTVAVAVFAIVAALPLLRSEFLLVLAIDILVMALFAASLHFIMGLGGMVSFGHAAYFGLGAYGAALAMKFLGAGMIVGLFAGPLLAAAGALVFGWFCVRLSGVYLAMLTLAAAQIVWSIGLQWGSVTGGDDGILGVRPLPLFASKAGFLYLTLALCGGAILLLRRMAHAPFGYVLRGGRDSPLRTEAIGIDLMRHQWYAFVASGFFAGIAGAIFVYSKGSIFPTELSIPRSVDGLVMVLLGGIQSLSGPIVGAVSFTLLTDLISRLAFWRAILGITIVALVVLAPEGLAGFGRRISRLWGTR